MKRDIEVGGNVPFNMGLATLERINGLLIIITDSWIKKQNRYIVTIRSSIYQLYKELYPFLKAKEKEMANDYWQRIMAYKIYRIDDGSIRHLKWDAELRFLLHEFEFWIRDKLKDKKLLMFMGDEPAVALGQS